MRADEICAPLEFLCNSPQRLQILDVLDSTQLDVRDVVDKVDGSRSTVQRNLSALEQRGWINDTGTGYTTTTIGRLLCKEFVATSETVNTIIRMGPFFDMVTNPDEIDVGFLSDIIVKTPDSGQPTSLMNRLFDIFQGEDHVRGLLPVVSSLSVELSRRAAVAEDNVPECDYIISLDAFKTLYQQYGSDGSGDNNMDTPDHINVYTYKGDLPYGLFVSDKQFALTAYDEIGRIEAIVESTSNKTIKWGDRQYEKYRRQSTQFCESEHSSATHGVESFDQSSSSI